MRAWRALAAACWLGLAGCNTWAVLAVEGEGLPCEEDEGCPGDLYCDLELGTCQWPEEGGTKTCQDSMSDVWDCGGDSGCFDEVLADTCGPSQDALTDIADCAGGHCSDNCYGGQTVLCMTCLTNSCGSKLADCNAAGCD